MQSFTPEITGTDTSAIQETLLPQIEAAFLELFSIQIDSPEQNFYDTGILDSVVLVELILHLEQRFQIELPMEALDLNSFSSVRAIANLISTQQLLQNT